MDRWEVNRYLGQHGLSNLDNPHELIPQLAFLIEGHDHLRRLLARCEPAERNNMYEALRPHLDFEPRPLDVYISEAGAIAERDQLPTVDADGKLYPYRTIDIRTMERAIDQTLAAHHLSVTCRKCTKTETFHGYSRRDAVTNLRNAGWTWDEQNGSGLEICPECPAVRS